jgi:hypothetical protein
LCDATRRWDTGRRYGKTKSRTYTSSWQGWLDFFADKKKGTKVEKINVTIKKDGSIDYKVQGVQGRACKEVGAFIDRMGRISGCTHTSEYSQTEATGQVQEVEA